MPLATVVDLAEYLGVEVAELNVGQSLMAMARAEARVLRGTGQSFEAGTTTTLLPMPDDEWLVLPQRPVTAVTSVSINGLALTDFTRVRDRLYRYGGWRVAARFPPFISVTYSHGGAVPAEVTGTVCALAAELLENPNGLASETIDDYTWRAAETGSAADAALQDLVRTYARRSLTVPIR